MFSFQLPKLLQQVPIVEGVRGGTAVGLEAPR